MNTADHAPITGQRFAGTCVVVTGGARGIGAATARRLAAEGGRVLIADVADTEGEQLAERIRDDGGQAVFQHCDVADEHSWHDAVEAAHEHLGTINSVVSNAYAVRIASLADTGLEAWNQQLAVSLTGSFLGIRAFLPDLLRTRGSVVLVSSVHALVGLPGRPAYAAAKAGLTGLTRQLAVEYAPDVRVNAILPGPVLTRAWDDIGPDERARSAEQTAVGRLGSPDEVAGCAAFLLSADASFVTGASLVVDGGWSVLKDSS